MCLQKGISIKTYYFLLASLRSLTKSPGSRAGFRSVSQRYGSEDTVPLEKSVKFSIIHVILLKVKRWAKLSKTVLKRPVNFCDYRDRKGEKEST
jgi:hypothetical protein